MERWAVRDTPDNQVNSVVADDEGRRRRGYELPTKETGILPDRTGGAAAFPGRGAA